MISLVYFFARVSNFVLRIIEFQWYWYKLSNFWYCDIPTIHRCIHAYTVHNHLLYVYKLITLHIQYLFQHLLQIHKLSDLYTETVCCCCYMYVSLCSYLFIYLSIWLYVSFRFWFNKVNFTQTTSSCKLWKQFFWINIDFI